MHKKCCRCEQIKPLDDFPPRKESADKRGYACRECARLRSAEYHVKHKDKRNSKAREWRKAHPETDRAYGAKYRTKFVWRMVLQHAKKRAAKFGWEYDLDRHKTEIIHRIAAMTCEMTGTPLVPGVGAGSQGKRFYNTVSIDRIDPLKGYTYDNIRIVCWAMNCALGTWGEARLKTIMTNWLNKG